MGWLGWGDRSGLKCPCATQKQLDVKVFGQWDMVCSAFVQHQTLQGLDPLLGLLGTAFIMKTPLGMQYKATYFLTSMERLLTHISLGLNYTLSSAFKKPNAVENLIYN